MYLDMSINEVIELEIIVILAKRVDQSFCDFEPTDVKDELEDEEKW